VRECVSHSPMRGSHMPSHGFPGMSTMLYSSNASFGGILLFLVFFFDLFFVFCPAFWVEDVS
jgi:hypothetical protein